MIAEATSPRSFQISSDPASSHSMFICPVTSRVPPIMALSSPLPNAQCPVSRVSQMTHILNRAVRILCRQCIFLGAIGPSIVAIRNWLCDFTATKPAESHVSKHLFLYQRSNCRSLRIRLYIHASCIPPVKAPSRAVHHSIFPMPMNPLSLKPAESHVSKHALYFHPTNSIHLCFKIVSAPSKAPRQLHPMYQSTFPIPTPQAPPDTLS